MAEGWAALHGGGGGRGGKGRERKAGRQHAQGCTLLLLLLALRLGSGVQPNGGSLCFSHRAPCQPGMQPLRCMQESSFLSAPQPLVLCACHAVPAAYSIIFDQAENRMHAQNGIMIHAMGLA